MSNLLYKYLHLDLTISAAGLTLMTSQLLIKIPSPPMFVNGYHWLQRRYGYKKVNLLSLYVHRVIL